jgi:hypothetical protein
MEPDGAGIWCAAGSRRDLNRDLYRLFYDHGGVRLAVRGFLLQQLYYLYSLVGLAAGVLIHCARRIANAGAA